MTTYYTVYSSKISMQPDSAHEIHDVTCAGASANLGYPTVIVYPNERQVSYNIMDWLNPDQPELPDRDFIDFFNIQSNVKTQQIPVVGFSKFLKIPKFDYNRLLHKYYLSNHVLPKSKVIHTRDWNCATIAVQNQVPVIYERHYYPDRQYEPTIVGSPFFKIAIAQSEAIRQSLVDAGMPAEKTVWMHNGFNRAFLERQPEGAEQWREELLRDGREYLVIYSGALYPFKGVDLLIDVAEELPEIQFALTGGTVEQVESYRQMARDRQVDNIDFLGWILPRSRLVDILQAADLLAHPHRSGKSANFTNPIKFFQYISSGTPIVATEIPPLMEFKNAPIAAIWCEPDRPIAFAQAIQDALRTYPRKTTGYQENIEFSRQFTWEERIRKILRSIQISFPEAII